MCVCVMCLGYRHNINLLFFLTKLRYTDRNHLCYVHILKHRINILKLCREKIHRYKGVLLFLDGYIFTFCYRISMLLNFSIIFVLFLCFSTKINKPFFFFFFFFF